MSDTIMDQDVVTDTTETPSQAQGKTYSQKEVDDMMAGLKASVAKKFEKKFEGVDVTEYQTLKQQAEAKQLEEATKRGEFDKVLQELASKKDAEIQKRDSIIKEYKVNTPLLEAAGRYRSVNPDQVKALLAHNVRMNTEGEVEVVDSKGAVRYNDAGIALSVDELVKEFLDQNPHFVAPTPATTHTKSSVSGASNGKIDVSKLDMKNPEHRKIYADAKAQGKL